MKRHSRISTVLLLAASLLLSSCGIIVMDEVDLTGDTRPADSDNTQDTVLDSYDDIVIIDNTSAYEKASQMYFDALPEADFENATFIITSPRPDLIHPQENGTVLSRAKYTRNEKIESRFNVRLVSSAMSEDTYAEQLRISVQADEYFADLLMIPQQMIGTLTADHLLMNLNSLPFLNMDMPYFNESSVRASTFGHATYALAGDASFEMTMLTGVYFNRGLFEQNGITLPYKDVYAGTWTWDRFFEICAAVPTLNANGEHSYASFSTQYVSNTLPSSVFFSAGGRFVNVSEGGSATLAYSAETAASADIVRRLYTDSNAYISTSDGVSRFYSGNSLFMIDRLYLTSWMINGTQNWGILPLPKADTAQPDYVSLMDAGSLFFAAQKNTSDAKSTSLILSALNAASYGVISDAYIKNEMHHVLRDAHSANMLETLVNTHTYDFSFSFGQTDNTLSSATYLGLKNVANGTAFSVLTDRIDTVNAHLSSRYPGNK